jgi:hypothetical protein
VKIDLLRFRDKYFPSIEDLEEMEKAILEVSSKSKLKLYSRSEFLSLILKLGQKNDFKKILAHFSAFDVLKPLYSNLELNISFYLNQDLLHDAYQYHFTADPLERKFTFNSAWRFLQNFFPLEYLVYPFVQVSHDGTLDFTDFLKFLGLVIIDHQ